MGNFLQKNQLPHASKDASSTTQLAQNSCSCGALTGLADMTTEQLHYPDIKPFWYCIMIKPSVFPLNLKIMDYFFKMWTG